MNCLAVLLADVVNGADVGVIQGRCGLRFAPESVPERGVSGYLSGRNFRATKRWSRVSSAL